MDDQIKDGATIYTDDSRMYDWMDKSGWEHHKVRHSRGSYVSELPHSHPADRRVLVPGRSVGSRVPTMRCPRSGYRAM